MPPRSFPLLLILPFTLAAGAAFSKTPATPPDPNTLPIEEANYCEICAVASSLGLNYPELVYHAAKGDIQSVRRLLRFTTTAALNSTDNIAPCAADTHSTVLFKILQNIGDAKFAAALNMESPRMRAALFNDLGWNHAFLTKWYPRTASAAESATPIPTQKSPPSPAPAPPPQTPNS